MRFIFVGGCGRSGTTLVQKLLVSHSRIAGGPEFDYAPEICSLYQRMSTPEALERQAYFYTQQRLKTIFSGFYNDFFSDVRSANPGVSFIAEKTPVNITVAEQLLELFPDSVFVDVIRDGRDVLKSHIDVHRRYREKGVSAKGFDIASVSRLWNSAIDKHFMLRGHPAYASRVFTVRFEELVSEPHKAVPALMAFLGLEVENELFNPEALRIEKIEPDDVWYTKQMLEQGFNKSRIGRWRESLSPGRKFIGHILMGRNLKRLGYEIAPMYSAFAAIPELSAATVEVARRTARFMLGKT